MRRVRFPCAFLLILPGIVALGLVGLELVARRIWMQSTFPATIFAEHAHVQYKTRELDAFATINGFGFRGAERRIQPGQIATLGDSFTFGWGVFDADTWQHKLQSQLSGAGMPLAVYNLGKPAADPEDYLEIARAHLPALRPRIVVLSLLQGDDPAQLLERATPALPMPARRRSAAQTVKATVRGRLPGLLTGARALSLLPATQISDGWAALAQEIISNAELAPPEDLRERWLSGNLNPGLLYLAANHPRRMTAAYDDANTVKWHGRLVEIVRQIDGLTRAGGGSLLLLSMPFGPYYDSDSRRTYLRMGYELPALGFCRMEQAATRVAEAANVRLVLTGPLLERHERLASLWYRYDGHMTAAGNDVIARVLHDAILRLDQPQSASPAPVCR